MSDTTITNFAISGNHTIKGNVTFNEDITFRNTSLATTLDAKADANTLTDKAFTAGADFGSGIPSANHTFMKVSVTEPGTIMVPISGETLVANKVYHNILFLDGTGTTEDTAVTLSLAITAEAINVTVPKGTITEVYFVYDNATHVMSYDVKSYSDDPGTPVDPEDIFDEEPKPYSHKLVTSGGIYEYIEKKHNFFTTVNVNDKPVQVYSDEFFVTQYASQRQGKILTIRVPNQLDSAVSAPGGNGHIKPFDDLADAYGEYVCPAPKLSSIDSYGEDLYWDKFLVMRHWTCNYVMDDDGNPRITKIKGIDTDPETGFKANGPEVDVGEFGVSFWVRWESTPVFSDTTADATQFEYRYLSISDTPHESNEGDTQGWTLFRGCKRFRNGQHVEDAPYWCVSKYYDTPVKNSNGVNKLRSQPGGNLVTNQSLSTLFTWHESSNSTWYKGPGYHGVSAYLYQLAQIFFLLKYHTRNSQAIMKEVCETYNNRTGVKFNDPVVVNNDIVSLGDNDSNLILTNRIPIARNY